MSHTKGKWELDEQVMCIVSKNKELTTLICDIQVKGLFESEPLANARLISAAPDLLKACERLLRVYDSYDADERLVTERLAIQNFAEATISKAKKE